MNDYDLTTTTDERRPLSVTHLVFGLVFLGTAALWLVTELADIEPPVLSVSGPAILIGAGVIGLVASVLNSRRRTRSRDEDPYHLEEQ